MKMTDDWLCICSLVVPADTEHEHKPGYPPAERLQDVLPVSFHECGDGEQFAKLEVENEFSGE